jgi:hypothetical protein
MEHSSLLHFQDLKLEPRHNLRPPQWLDILEAPLLEWCEANHIFAHANRQAADRPARLWTGTSRDGIERPKKAH